MVLLMNLLGPVWIILHLKSEFSISDYSIADCRLRISEIVNLHSKLRIPQSSRLYEAKIAQAQRQE